MTPRVGALAAVVVLALSALVVASAPAQAADRQICSHLGKRGFACVPVRYDGHQLGWCDPKPDGHRVYVRYRNRDGWHKTAAISYDGVRCRNRWFSERPVKRFQVCVTTVGCGPLRRV